MIWCFLINKKTHFNVWIIFSTKLSLNNLIQGLSWYISIKVLRFCVYLCFYQISNTPNSTIWFHPNNKTIILQYWFDLFKAIILLRCFSLTSPSSCRYKLEFEKLIPTLIPPTSKVIWHNKRKKAFYILKQYTVYCFTWNIQYDLLR